jgi:putative ABC transport system permease protein
LQPIQRCILINRTAAAKLGFTPEQAIGKWIKNTFRDSTRRRVVGVVEDFNFLSLKRKNGCAGYFSAEDRRVVCLKNKTRQCSICNFNHKR